MSALQQALLAAGGVAAIPSDLLIHFNGTNGGTTFTDSSASARTVTLSGSVTTSTSNPKFGTAAGLFAGGRLEVGISIALNQDFCVECFVSPTGTGTAQALWSLGRAGSYYVTKTAGGGQYGFDYSWSIASASSGNVYATGTYRHVALTRSSNTIRFFVDGTQVGSSTTQSAASSASTLYIGNETGITNPFAGDMDEFRVVLGNAVYTSNFTPPASAFTA